MKWHTIVVYKYRVFCACEFFKLSKRQSTDRIAVNLTETMPLGSSFVFFKLLRLKNRGGRSMRAA